MASSTLQQLRKSARQIFVRCIPHALLCFTYFMYLIFGTLIFQAIEDHGSTQMKEFLDDVTEMRTRLENAMWNKTEGMSEDNWTALMDKYTDMVSQHEWKMFQDGRAWSFSSTMLFCLITITTIGYGDVVPVTTGGKVFLGFYASFGIPLNVIFLADIGYLLAKFIIYIMQAIKARREGKRTKKMVASRLPMRMRPTQHKGKRKNQGSLFASRALSVHGPKSVVIKTSPERPMRMQCSLRRGLSPEQSKKMQRSNLRNGVMSSNMMSVHGSKSVENGEIPKEPDHLYPRIDDTSFTEGGTASQANDGFESINLEAPSDVRKSTGSEANLVGNKQDPNLGPIELKTINNSDKYYNKKDSDNSRFNTKTDEVLPIATVESQDDSMMEEDHTEVPLIIVLLILITYVLLGAALMAAIEDWNYGDGLYFTFITLTTIGFGDMVATGHYKEGVFFIYMIYTVLGLAVMSTCIALTQAKILRGIDRFTAWIRSYS